MIRHAALGDSSFARVRKLKALVNGGEIAWGGNARLKIYGTLTCRSGKRMTLTNRVFFRDEAQAIASGYRPCGHCLREKYAEWRSMRME